MKRKPGCFLRFVQPKEAFKFYSEVKGLKFKV
jgi:hypothetical protein